MRPRGPVHTTPAEEVTTEITLHATPPRPPKVHLTVTDHIAAVTVNVALTAPQAAQLAQNLHRAALALNGVYGAPE